MPVSTTRSDRERQHDVAAPEHERAAGIERLRDAGDRVSGRGDRRQQHEQRREDRQAREPATPADRTGRGFGLGFGRSAFRGTPRPAQRDDPDRCPRGEHDDLDQRRRHREQDQRGPDRDRLAPPIRGERPGHCRKRDEHDGDRHQLEAVEPCRVTDVGRRDEEREQHERDGRGQREAEPREQAADRPRPQRPDRDADLAARGPRQELRQGDEVGEPAVVEPAASDDVLVPEIADVGDRAAERHEPQPQGDQQDLETASRRPAPVARARPILGDARISPDPRGSGRGTATYGPDVGGTGEGPAGAPTGGECHARVRRRRIR